MARILILYKAQSTMVNLKKAGVKAMVPTMTIISDSAIEANGRQVNTTDMARKLVGIIRAQFITLTAISSPVKEKVLAVYTCVSTNTKAAGSREKRRVTLMRWTKGTMRTILASLSITCVKAKAY